MSTLILRTAARMLTPLIVVLSIYLLLRGHDSPGGGFIGALVAGAAVVLQYLANGTEGVNRFLPVQFSTLLGLGLLMAVGVGLGGVVVGGQFLQSAIWKFDVPLLGELKVTASLGFDVGVFLVVLSVVVAIVRYLGEEIPESQEVRP
jgi:multicomponent Na+:H+ antiporter subunit A